LKRVRESERDKERWRVMARARVLVCLLVFVLGSNVRN